MSKVSPELWESVVRRDGGCFIKNHTEIEHVCSGPMTVDHVWHMVGGVRGKRAPSDEQHLTAMCWQANFDGPSREVRQAQREYLKGLYPGDD